MSKARDIADLDFNSPDIDGGNIDGATIGGTTPAAGSFLTGTFAGNITQSAGDYLYSSGGNFDIKHIGAGQNIVFSTTPSGGSVATPSLRISSTGSVVVGGDGEGADNAVTLSGTGYIQARIDNDTVAYFDRTGSGDNGEVVRIMQNGSTVGSIGTAGASNELYIGGSGTNTSGVYFANSGYLVPMKALALSNNTQSIGHPSYKYKDLHMLGTLNGISTTKSASGNRWGILPEVESNGVMEVGRYIDFHATDGDTSDYGARLDFDGTNLITAANSSLTGTLDVSGNVEFATTQGAGYAGAKNAGLEIGTVASGGSLLVRTPSLNSSFSSGLLVDGAYSSELSQVNLTAAGVHSGGGYEGHLHLRTTSQTAIWPAITAKPNSLQFYTANTERMSISATGEISRTTANNAIDDSITTLRYVYPNSNVARASCQCDVMYSTEHLGHNTTLWLSVLTPQATANWNAGGSATFKLTWSGFHAAGTSMAKWDCVFGNNHSGDNFRWARSAVSMLEAPDSYYGYTPGVEFYRQTADGNGFTGGATTMRVLWIKITGNASSNVCPTRTLEISGVVGGPTMKYVVAHGGYSTPTNISAIGASV